MLFHYHIEIRPINISNNNNNINNTFSNSQWSYLYFHAISSRSVSFSLITGLFLEVLAARQCEMADVSKFLFICIVIYLVTWQTLLAAISSSVFRIRKLQCYTPFSRYIDRRSWAEGSHSGLTKSRLHSRVCINHAPQASAAPASFRTTHRPSSLPKFDISSSILKTNDTHHIHSTYGHKTQK